MHHLQQTQRSVPTTGRISAVLQQVVCGVLRDRYRQRLGVVPHAPNVLGSAGSRATLSEVPVCASCGRSTGNNGRGHETSIRELVMRYECSNCCHESDTNTGPCGGCKLSAPPRRIVQTTALGLRCMWSSECENTPVWVPEGSNCPSVCDACRQKMIDRDGNNAPHMWIHK